MAYDYGDAGMDFGDAQFGDTNFSDFGGLGDLGDYIGGGWNDSTTGPQVPDLAAGYDLMSNPNSMQVPSDPAQDFQESGFSQWGKQNPFANKALGFLSSMHPVTALAYGAASQNKGMVPGMAGKSIGGAIAGLPGAMFGGWAGSAFGAGLPGYAGGPSGSGGANGMSGGDMAETLMQLYGASRANEGMGGVGNMNTALQAQVQRLSEIYGPNSPYAAQMRQELARKDAKAGRNSQYGPREAQLQALLAEKQTQATDAMTRAATAGNTNALAMAKYKQQLLGQRLGLAANIGKKTGLFNIFNGSGGPLGGVTLGGAANTITGDAGLASSLTSGGDSFFGGNLNNGATFSSGSSSNNPLLSFFD